MSLLHWVISLDAMNIVQLELGCAERAADPQPARPRSPRLIRVFSFPRTEIILALFCRKSNAKETAGED